MAEGIGRKLDRYLRQADPGGDGLKGLLHKNQLRYILFVYDLNPNLSSELSALFACGQAHPDQRFRR